MTNGGKMKRRKLNLYDAFETREDAKNLAGDLDNFHGERKVRKLRGKQRLQYGVYTEK